MFNEKKDLAKVAKLKLLEELSEKMAEMMMEKGSEEESLGLPVDEMQKVTVAAKDPESLKEGLSTAEQLVAKLPQEDEEESDIDGIDLEDLMLEDDEEDSIV